MTVNLRTLKDLNVENKRVLVRIDLNVPMAHGKVEDATRIQRILPTLQELIRRNAKVIMLSHFGRPKGEFDRDMSLAPLADAVSKALGGKEVHFAVDCIGHSAQEAVDALEAGELLLLENVRFHKGETTNDPKFIKELAKLADFYVNDTFSCSHREHASIAGIAKALPSAAGLLLQDEIENLERVLERPEHPVAAVVGGSKVSTKLAVLENLMSKTDMIIIGGAMANTFLAAKGYAIGKSLYEADLLDTAKAIIEKAEKQGCEIVLPTDVVTAEKFEANPPCKITDINNVGKDDMILDIGPASLAALHARFEQCKTVVWNGPLGAFELSPFDVGTINLARTVASLTAQGKLISVGGGGDIVAALGNAGLKEQFTYISTAGGAFLEWLEGKELPGVAVLQSNESNNSAKFVAL